MAKVLPKLLETIAEKELTVETVASKAQMSVRTVYNAAKRGVPLNTAKRIASAVGVKLEVLL